MQSGAKGLLTSVGRGIGRGIGAGIDAAYTLAWRSLWVVLSMAWTALKGIGLARIIKSVPFFLVMLIPAASAQFMWFIVTQIVSATGILDILSAISNLEIGSAIRVQFFTLSSQVLMAVPAMMQLIMDPLGSNSTASNLPLVTPFQTNSTPLRGSGGARAPKAEKKAARKAEKKAAKKTAKWARASVCAPGRRGAQELLRKTVDGTAKEAAVCEGVPR